MAAPMIPFVNDSELEAILEAAARAGATSAGYVTLRLPHELEGIFGAWLEAHVPGRVHVLETSRRLGRRRRGRCWCGCLCLARDPGHGLLLGIDHAFLTFRHNGIDRRLTDVHGHVIHQILS